MVICKTAYWNSAGSEHSALATESEFLTYSVDAHEFDKPARVTVILKDEDGSTMQKYGVKTNQVYAGPGRVYIEDPDATPIFDGRIVKAIPNMAGNRLILICADWMSQLGEERLDYDMREPLDNASLRQSELKSDIRLTGVANSRPTYTVGGSYWMYDLDMLDAWIQNQWNGYFVSFSNSIAGDITVTTGPYDADPFVPVASSSGGHSDCWEEDGSYFEVVGDGVNNVILDFDFRVFVTEGSLFSSGPRSATVEITISLNGSAATLQIYDYDAVGGVTIGSMPDNGDSTYRKYTFSVPEHILPDIVSSGGLSRIFLTGMDSTVTVRVDKLLLNVSPTTIGTSLAMEILDTVDVDYDVLGCVYDFGGGEVDETTDANDSGTNDLPLLDDPISQGDLIYFGFDAPCDDFDLTVGTAGDWTGTITWQYSTGGDTWETLADISDGTNAFRNAGRNTIGWTRPTDWVTDSVGAITAYWVRAIVITALPATVTSPLGTQAFMPHSNKLLVDTDLSITGLGLWEGAEYCIIQPIFKHIDTAEGGTLITGGSPIMPLTAAANVEHTTGLSTRHHTERTRLEILQDNTKKDQASCWIPLGTVDLTYKKTFNAGAPTAITDADVLFWSGGGYDYSLMRNEFHQYGARIGDSQLVVHSEDIVPDPGVDSKTKFGIARTQVETNSGILTSYDTVSIAIANVERNEDVHLFLDAVIAGLSTLRLGAEVSITSTYLDLTAEKYVVVHFSFDLATWRTKIRLHPRGSTGFVNRSIFGERIRDSQELEQMIEIDQVIPELYSQSWDNQ